MITYIDLEGTLYHLELNCKSLDQTLEAMHAELEDADINSSWREVEKSYRGYQNIIRFLRGEIKGLFKELEAIVKAGEEPDEEEEEAQA